jgi:hypothetical protein
MPEIAIAALVVAGTALLCAVFLTVAVLNVREQIGTLRTELRIVEQRLTPKPPKQRRSRLEDIMTDGSGHPDKRRHKSEEAT